MFAFFIRISVDPICPQPRAGAGLLEAVAGPSASAQLAFVFRSRLLFGFGFSKPMAASWHRAPWRSRRAARDGKPALVQTRPGTCGIYHYLLHSQASDVRRCRISLPSTSSVTDRCCTKRCVTLRSPPRSGGDWRTALPSRRAWRWSFLWEPQVGNRAGSEPTSTSNCTCLAVSLMPCSDKGDPKSWQSQRLPRRCTAWVHRVPAVCSVGARGASKRPCRIQWNSI